MLKDKQERIWASLCLFFALASFHRHESISLLFHNPPPPPPPSVHVESLAICVFRPHVCASQMEMKIKRRDFSILWSNEDYLVGRPKALIACRANWPIARDPWSPPINGWGGHIPWMVADTGGCYPSRGGKSTGRVKSPRMGWVKSMGKGDRELLRGMK